MEDQKRSWLSRAGSSELGGVRIEVRLEADKAKQRWLYLTQVPPTVHEPPPFDLDALYCPGVTLVELLWVRLGEPLTRNLLAVLTWEDKRRSAFWLFLILLMCMVLQFVPALLTAWLAAYQLSHRVHRCWRGGDQHQHHEHDARVIHNRAEEKAKNRDGCLNGGKEHVDHVDRTTSAGTTSTPFALSKASSSGGIQQEDDEKKTVAGKGALPRSSSLQKRSKTVPMV